MQKTTVLFSLLLLAGKAGAQTYRAVSPDNKTTVTLTTGTTLALSVEHNNQPLLSNSTINLVTDFTGSPAPFKVRKSSQRSIHQVFTPVVKQKQAAITDDCNELSVVFTNQLSLDIRAYNNGIAYRWSTSYGKSFKVISEQADFGLEATDTSWYPIENSFFSHNERLYKQYAISRITKDSLASLPTLVAHRNTKLVFTEADLFDYPGMWLVGNGSNQLQAVFPAYPAEEQEKGDRSRLVVRRAGYIAEVKGARSFPWRIVMIADNDGDLVTNLLPYQLNRATTEDFSWVKAGKAQWDWWNANNVRGVDFRAGVNTATYKYYIDFASKNNLPYVVLDEGWSDTRDLLKQNPEVNMDELAAYAREKNVSLVLWVNWMPLDKQLEPALDKFAQWGVKGIKVDFMQRDDQKMVNYYERVAKAAAQRKMLVDFHGAYKPTGMEHLYPNVITREGVYGLENSKWDIQGNNGPEHCVTLPFIRMAAGPMDYTPGAMVNAQKNSWAVFPEKPMSLGTRCQQLAMYVVFESPLQMLADNPGNYMREPECLEFLRAVPTEWTETKVLQAKLGDYIAVARKAANGDWYIGAMTDWTPRDLELDLSFLDGNYALTAWQDGINADRDGMDFKKTSQQVDAGKKLTVHLAPGGGYAARLVKQ